jgi:hypothetical protein
MSWRHGDTPAEETDAKDLPAFGRNNEMNDVKVAAVDDVWSGLKLVIREERREAVRTTDAIEHRFR